MLRSRWFSWGLCSALTFTACGGSDDGGLFGFITDSSDPNGGTASSVDPSLGETGGRGGAAGGASTGKGATSNANTGGKATGGTASGSTGGRGSVPTGGRNSTGGRSSSNGGTGTGGDPQTGGEAPTGGTVDAGGAPGETGGNGGEPSSSGGTTGGTTGGTNTGGTSTGGTTGGSATGGQNGNPACDEARLLMQEALENAQRCDPSEGVEACTGALHNDCNCGVPVNKPDSPEGTAYTEAVDEVVGRCGRPSCLACPEFSAFVCMSDSLGNDDTALSGHCEGIVIVPLPTLPQD